MPAPSRSMLLPAGLALAAAAGACTTASTAPPAATGTVRERIVALALRQIEFGSISLLPVRFEHSRIAGPFEDGGRTLYCVSTRMKGRTLGKGERAKLVVRQEAGALKALSDEEEVCEGHRTEPFAELDAAGTNGIARDASARN